MPDLFPEHATQQAYLINAFMKEASLSGFQPLLTPILEPLETFQRSVGETSDIVSKEMYRLEDRNGKPLCLRPEGTAGLVRAILNAKKQNDAGQKYCYWGPMFRYERPQKGRLRQFHQLGVEHIAAPSPLADAEVIALAHAFIQSIGITNFTLELNSLGDEATRLSHKEALVSYYKQHESGLSEDSQRRLHTNPLRILDSKNPQDQKINQKAPALKDHLTPDAAAFFDQVCTALEALNIPYTLNPTLVRGLDYYCHTIFEFTSPELGAQGTFLAGGRYDKLATLLGGAPLPSIGWAAGIERLALLAKFPEISLNKILVVPGQEEAMIPALKITHLLRSHGFSTETHTSPSIKSGLKRANKELIPFVILMGETELKEETYTLKTMSTGEQETLHAEALITLLKKNHESI